MSRPSTKIRWSAVEGSRGPGSASGEGAAGRTRGACAPQTADGCRRSSEPSGRYEVVVVGAGPAGMAAACAAAESGRSVAVVDNTPWLGGQIWRGEQAHPATPEAQRWLERFRRSGAILLDRTSVIAAPGAGVLLAEHEDRPREIGYGKLILATGARELFLPFPGWTLPGVVGPGGLQAMVKNGWPIDGKRVLIAGTGPLLLAVADGLKKHGAKIVAIVDQAPLARVARSGLRMVAYPGKLWQGVGLKSRTAGIPYRTGVWPVRAEGEGPVQRVTLTNGRRTWTEACDYLACGFHLVPNVELPLAVGCALQDGFVRVDEWQATGTANVFCAGEPTGVGGVDCALVEGRIAGYAATGQTGKAEALFGARRSWHRFRRALAKTFALRDELKTLPADDTLLCRCEDVPIGRVRQHADWRAAKLLTRCGMGSCQGRVCGSAAKFLLGWGMESVRPPVLPTRLSSLVTSGGGGCSPDAG